MQPYQLSISTGRGGDGIGEGVNVGGRGGDVAINLNYGRESRGIERLRSLRARHAEYNSAREDAPSSCLEGTRVDILADIMSWLRRTDGTAHPVYWLNGLAGIGKSTIATTVVKRAEEEGMLGATFFFSRADRALRDPHTVFPTLAFQLANADNQFKAVIAEALERDEGIEDRNSLLQIEGLIVNPLLKIHGKRRPTLIVLDALDECDERGAADILRLLFSHATRIPFLRIFITSRPEHHISSVFNQFQNHARTILHNVEASVIQHDIHLYIQTELEKIPRKLGLSMSADWTTEAERHVLVEKSGKLFIYAATCIRFIGDDRALAPREHLGLILGTQTFEGEDLSEVTPYKQLDRLYTRLLRKSLSDSNPCLVQNRFQVVVGSLVLLRQPLPLRSLAKFVGKEIETINNVLRHLHSVIIPPSNDHDAPRIYHFSFIDFITSASRCTMAGFLIVAVPVQEQRHALRCFRLMETCLKRDVAGIGDPSLLNCEVEGFEARMANALPLEVQYACQFWASHLSHVEVGDEKVMEAPEEFSMRSILWWVEAMSLIGSIYTVASSIQEAHRWAMSSKCKLTLVTMLSDAHRFILAHAEVIKASALHIYHSALPFTPHDTVLYKVYCREASESVGVLQGVESQWPQSLSSLLGHDGWVHSVAFSPDGLRLASGSDDSSIRLWDATSGAPIALLEGHSDTVHSVAFSPDGLRLVSGSSDRSVRLWDTTSGAPIALLEGHSRSVRSVAFSPDGLQLASGSMDCSVMLWEASLGMPIALLEGPLSPVNSVAFSPDGLRLASGSRHSVWLWDVPSRVPIALLEGHSNRVNSVAFSPNGLCLASCSNDCSIRLWDATSGIPIALLGGHSYAVNCVAFSPDGLRLASASHDYSIRLWDTASGTPIATLEGHSQSVNSVAFSADGLRLASGSEGPSIRLWDNTSSAPITPLAGHSYSVNSVAFSLDGLRLASGSGDGSVRLWDAMSGAPIGVLEGHSSWINCVAFSPDGVRLASSSHDYSIRLWDTASGTPIATLKGHSQPVNSVAFSPDGLRLASGSDDSSMRLWDATIGAPIAMLVGGSGTVHSVAFSPDGLRLASGYSDGSIWLWDVMSGMPIETLGDHWTWVSHFDISFSIDSQTLISKTPAEVLLWDLTSQPPCRLDFDSFAVTRLSSVAFVPPIWSYDGQWVTVQSSGSPVRRICYIPPFYEPFSNITVMGFPIQSRLALGCTDGRVIILDIQHCM